MVKEALTARFCAEAEQFPPFPAGTGLEGTQSEILMEKIAMVGDRRKSIFGGLLLLVLFVGVFYASWIYFGPKDAGLPGLPGLASEPAAGSYGALAMSDDTGNYGTAWGFSDPVTAEQRSLAECQKSGGQNCIIKTSLNGNCGSLVTSGQARQSYVVTDADKLAAAAFGLAQCQASGAQDCAVKAQFCGNGG